MTEAQKRLRDLKARQSRERQRMAELATAESLTDETRAELDTIESGTPDLERQIRAATVAVEQEDAEAKAAGEACDVGPDVETRERVELRSKAQLTRYFRAAFKGRLPDGAEAELQAAAGVDVDGIPLELWDVPRGEVRDGETRAVTPAPATVGVNLDPIVPAVFANSVAPRLGIDMPRVPSGTYAIGRITTSQTAAPKAKGDPIAATAGAIGVSTATPQRVSARLELAIEDIVSIGTSNFESILRENLALVLSDALDNQALNGDGSDDNLTGIFQALTDPNDPAAGVASFDTFVAAFAGGIDGLWANRIADVGIVAGVDTYKLSAQTFRDATGQDLGAQAFSDYAAAHMGGWWTNKRMPATAAHVQQAILHRKGRSMAGGSPGMRTAVCPHWGRISIDDIYTGAAKAERSFNLHVLLGDVILVQPDAYEQVAFRVSA